MKHIIKLLLVAIIATFSVSINSYAQKTSVSYEVSYQEASARIMEPSASVMSIPLVCNIKVVGDKINFTEREAFKDFVVTEQMLTNMLNFKQIALCNAALANKVDIIIAASIKVITNDSGRLEITVTGYPAKYENFRPATQEEINLINSAKGSYHDRSGEILGRSASQLKVEDTQVKKGNSFIGLLNE